MPTVLSIQSWVACGNVGNTAALFPLQRLGCETWSLNTVAFSNHTGYGKWRGAAVPAQEIASLFEGIAELGILPRCDAVLSGYLGEAAYCSTSSAGSSKRTRGHCSPATRSWAMSAPAGMSAPVSRNSTATMRSRWPTS
jgi:hypothetical protein